MSLKYSIEDVKKFFFDFGYTVDEGEKYKDVFEKINFTDNFGYKYFLSFDSFRKTIRKGYIPLKFSLINPYSIENIKLWIEINNCPFSYVSGEFVDAHELNLCFRCHICDEEWTTCWNYIETERHCSSKECLYARAKEGGRKKFLTKEHNFLSLFPDLAIGWDYSKNKFSPSEITPKSGYMAHWICSICGHNWPAKVHNRANGTGCPVCKLSRGEKRIESYLRNKNIDYIPQYSFDDCRNINLLPFDFYLPEYNRCIEYQGEQHYGILRNNFFGGEEALKKRQGNDLIKEEYCKRNKIGFMAISYLNFDSIENILDNYFIIGG